MRLTWCRHPQLGRAALKNWISTILEAVEDTDEEEGEEENERVEGESQKTEAAATETLHSEDETDEHRRAEKT